jgi:hypothetical protein
MLTAILIATIGFAFFLAASAALWFLVVGIYAFAKGVLIGLKQPVA